MPVIIKISGRANKKNRRPFAPVTKNHGVKKGKGSYNRAKSKNHQYREDL